MTVTLGIYILFFRKMRKLIIIIAVILLASCERDPMIWICPEKEVIIRECPSPFGTKNTYKHYDIDTAYLKGDSVLYYIEAPPEYDCANLEFCTNEIFAYDTLPTVRFTHLIRSRWSSPERVVELFTYDISFLDQWFEGDSIRMQFRTKNAYYTEYYKK